MTQPPDWSSQPQGPSDMPPGAFNPPPAYPAPGQAPPPPPPAGGYAYGYTSAAPAVVPPGMYFDQLSGLVLPEGVQLASSGRRIGAYFLSIPLFIGTLVIGYFVWGLIVWGRGQTPALQVLGMRCWKPETGRVSGWGNMALREIVGRIVESLFITAIISFVLMLTRRDRQSLHDLIAGTVVLRDPNKVLAPQPNA